MIPRKYASLVFSFFMSFIMSGIMSLVISFINLGDPLTALAAWPKAWSIAFLVAFPTIVAVTPVVRFCVARVTEHEG